jgi:hypothetical protein
MTSLLRRTTLVLNSTQDQATLLGLDMEIAKKLKAAIRKNNLSKC